jgi:hypothetical protein
VPDGPRADAGSGGNAKKTGVLFDLLERGARLYFEHSIARRVYRGIELAGLPVTAIRIERVTSLETFP